MIPIIIPFYKHQDQLDRCIEHLNKQSQKVEVFIRDNNADNVYFTKAINEGIRKYLSQDCPYMMILNQDMYLEPTAIEEMVAFMDAHPKCGIGSALEILKNHPQQHAAGGGLDLFPLGVRSVGPVSRFQHNEQVLWASGSCLMLRKHMIQEIGLWDENFVFIHSDGDYCLTARSRGWEVWRIGKALGHHELGTTGHTDDLNIELLKVKDVIHFSKKWLSGDLYRELSYDAAKCTPEFIQETVQESLRKIPVLEALIASGKTSIQDLAHSTPNPNPSDQKPSATTDTVARTLRQATGHLQSGELAQADKLLRDVLEKEPNHPIALHAMSLIAYQQQNFEDAAEFAAGAMIVDKQNALLYNTLGVVCEAMSQHDRGINAYQEAIKINPRYAEAYMNLAIAYQHQGLHERAVETGKQAIELEPACAERLQAIVSQGIPEDAATAKESL
jgi:GT2 family glycosyltransferase/Tfp pilus assembly protein PilF